MTMNHQTPPTTVVLFQRSPFSEQEWAAVFRTLRVSPRQRRIVMLIVSGKGDKQIADELGMAVPTLRTHISRMFARLDITNRVELVLRVFCEFRRGCRDCPRRHLR